MPSFMLPSGGGPSKVTTENFTAGNIKTGVTIIVKYRGKDLYKVLGTFTNDANAAAADILNTKTAYVNGNKVTGSMPNIGAVSQSLAINGTYNVPKGYHNGSGRVTQSIPTQGAKTVTPSKNNQTAVTAGRYLTGDITVKGDGNLVAGNIKSGVSIFGVSGSLTASSMMPAGTNMLLGYTINQGENLDKTYTVPEAGTYTVALNFRGHDGDRNGGYYVQIIHNGSYIKNDSDNYEVIVDYYIDLQCNKGDTIQVRHGGYAPSRHAHLVYKK